jgi:hypothetical protein
VIGKWANREAVKYGHVLLGKLLALASKDILGTKSRGSSHILQSHDEDQQ